jgi:hypothetical protein
MITKNASDSLLSFRPCNPNYHHLSFSSFLLSLQSLNCIKFLIKNRYHSRISIRRKIQSIFLRILALSNLPSQMLNLITFSWLLQQITAIFHLLSVHHRSYYHRFMRLIDIKPKWKQFLFHRALLRHIQHFLC